MNASHKVRRDGRINLKLCSRPKVMIFFLLKSFICSENLTLCVMLNQDVSETYCCFTEYYRVRELVEQFLDFSTKYCLLS